ncbi:MAG: dihydroorotate dehydrogenase, partial [Nitrospinae bacterium]|nr:dihydroorotate dehydrogenase [Nitrospinota bacterium]
MPSGPDISVKLGALELSNPVIAASGTFGYGLEFIPFLDLNRLGGFCTKGLSLKPRVGNPVPRVFETASGMLNAIGLENVGLEKFRDEKLPLLQPYRTRIIANFFGDTVQEYAEMAEQLSGLERIDALEMNISCPNVEEGGLAFSSSPRIVEQVVAAVRPVTSKYLIVKLSPNVTDICEIAQAAQQAGADAVSLVNTYLGMALDITTRKPYLANTSGGLSGPSIKPVALHQVYQVARAVTIPVIGIGGIRTAEDALEFLMAGASAVQVGTANFFDPAVTSNIIAGIRPWCVENC